MAFVLPCCNTAQYKRLQRVLRRPRNYTSHAAKQRTRLYRRFSCDFPHSTAANTRPTQTAIIPPAPRWIVSQRPDALQHIAYTTATPGRCTVHRNIYIIIGYIRAQGCATVMAPCQTVQHSRIPCKPGGVSVSTYTRLARRRSRYFPRPAACNLVRVSCKGVPGQLAPSTRRDSPAAGTGRAARNHWRLRRSFFRAFAR